MAGKDQKPLPLIWTSHIRNQKEKEDFEQALRNSTLTYDRLRQILLARLSDLDAVELDDKFYETPNIAERQIFLNARKRELRDILKLLAFF